MKQTLKTLTLTAAFSLAASLATAATATTDPVGALSIELRAGSDTFVGVPFAKAAEFQGLSTAIDTVTGVISTGATLANFTGVTNVSGVITSPYYYVRFTSGALNGRYYTITANTTTANSTITIDKNGEDWSGLTVSANETFKIVKYWTPGDLFPLATQTSFQLSTGTGGGGRRSQLLIYDVNSVGTNAASSKTLYINASGWTNTSTGAANANVNEILWPDSYFVIRHRVGFNPLSSTFFVSSGSVEMGTLTTNFNYRLGPVTTTLQDIPFSFARPKSLMLSELNLGTSFVKSLGTGGGGRRDTILVFDNVSIGQNKAPVKTYYQLTSNSQWRTTLDGVNDVSSDVIPAGAGVIVRKAGNTVSAGTHFYSNVPNY